MIASNQIGLKFLVQFQTIFPNRLHWKNWTRLEEKFHKFLSPTKFSPACTARSGKRDNWFLNIDIFWLSWWVLYIRQVLVLLAWTHCVVHDLQSTYTYYEFVLTKISQPVLCLILSSRIFSSDKYAIKSDFSFPCFTF